MRASAIVVAAGSGLRLGANIPKAFVPLAGSTLLGATLRTIARVSSIGEAVVTVPSGTETLARHEAAAAGMQIPVKIVAGGAERQESVRIALALTSIEAEVVIIHDAARPLVTRVMLEACLERASATGAAIIAIPVIDTLKRVPPGQDMIAGTVPRAGIWQAQTPQAFWRHLLLDAHTRALQAAIVATDDADLVEQTGVRVAVIAGSPLNLKITTADDLKLAQALATAPY